MLPLQHCTALETLTLTIHSPGTALTLPPVASAVSLRLKQLQLTATFMLRDAAAEAVVDFLQPLTGLHQLSIDLKMGEDKHWQPLAHAVVQMSDLQALDLPGKHLQDSALSAIASAVGQLRQLESLTLGNLPTSNASARALPEALASLPPVLTQLELQGNGTLLADAPTLTRALQAHGATLRTIALSYIHLCSANMAVLAPGLKRCSALASLDLSGCNFNADMADHLASALSDSARHLSHFSLCNNPLGYEGTSTLVPVLGSMTSLVSLSYTDNWLGPAGAAVLAEALVPLAPSLTFLNVSGNSFGDQGTMHLAPTLGCMTTLMSLEYARNELGPAGVANLAPAIASLAPSLTGLDISLNPLGVEGITALAPALERLASLDHLLCSNVTDAGFGFDGAAVLASALPAMSRLGYLDLQDFDLGFAGLRMVGRALQGVSKRQHWVIFFDYRLLGGITLNTLSQENSQVLASVFDSLGYRPSWEACMAPAGPAGFLLPSRQLAEAASGKVLGLQVTLFR